MSVIIAPWCDKKTFKELLNPTESMKCLSFCIIRYLNEGKEPEEVLDYLIELCKADTPKNIENREILESLYNAKYEKPKRKTKRRKTNSR